MSKQMIKARIEDLEERLFHLKLCGHWTNNDYDFYYKAITEIRNLKKMLDNQEDTCYNKEKRKGE